MQILSHKYLSLIFIFCLLIVVPFNYLTAQEQDTIRVIKKPKKLLRKIDVSKVNISGFNIFHDEFTGHWAGIDFGFNALLNKDYAGFEEGFMDNDLLRSNSTYINFFQQNIGLQYNRNTIGIVTGLGLHLQSYRLDKNTTIIRLADGTIAPRKLYFDDNQKSKLSIISLKIPLLLEAQIPVNHYDNRIYLSAGGYVGFRLDSHTKIKYRLERKEKKKVPDHYSIHKYEFGILARAGYRWINVFASYSLNPMFNDGKGPRLYPFTFGVTLIQF